MRQSLSALILLAVLLTGCSNSYQISSAAEHKEQVTLNVVTSYGQDDGSHDLYEAAVSNFQKETGVDIRDHSDVSSEKWKNKVLTDFITGSEPDVLFYFVDADAEPIVQAEKVVSIEEIRELYPDYASNMKGSMMPVAYDGRHYAVPSTGFWETMFVNKTVLDQCGIEIPGPDYTWSQFLEDCQTIKECGFIPIACSLFETPHYLFEFTVMNNGTVHDHYQCPRLTEDGQLKDEPVSRKWIQALNDIKLFYDEGFFPENTLTASDTETVSLFAEGKAAFLVDGSWKVGYFTENYPDHLNNYLVSYFPGKGGRAATDAIGGISMGYYITRKAWNDLDKRQAAVDFVSYMTSDDVLNTFVTTEVTALQNGTHQETRNPIEKSAAAALDCLSAVTGAVQDTITSEAKKELFSNISKVASGQMSAADAVKSALKFNE